MTWPKNAWNVPHVEISKKKTTNVNVKSSYLLKKSSFDPKIIETIRRNVVSKQTLEVTPSEVMFKEKIILLIKWLWQQNLGVSWKIYAWKLIRVGNLENITKKREY